MKLYMSIKIDSILYLLFYAFRNRKLFLVKKFLRYNDIYFSVNFEISVLFEIVQ